MEPAGKTVVITGGARVGSAVADALARRGARLAMVYRSSRRTAEDTVRRARSMGTEAMAFRADISKRRDAARLVARVARRFGRVDVLINMASLYQRTPLDTLAQGAARRRAWERALAVDARSAYELSLLCAPHMNRAGGGRIVNFCDWVAASGRPRYRGYTPYYIAKTAVKGLTESLALELAPRILVNAVAPGPILAPAGLSDKENKEVMAHTPLGRWGGPDEIAKAALFLIESDFVTGETLRVDGGRHLY